MDVFRASEVALVSTNIGRPVRTIEIPTNAPVQTVHSEIGPSSGTFTYPDITPFGDRFIVWRAYGTTLLLEERSVCRTIRESCIAFKFSRAPIIPGTKLSFWNNILSLVVTTQSSIHRFHCKLSYDPSDDDGNSMESTLIQLANALKNLTRSESHELHLLGSHGVPIRAAVASRPGDVRVAVMVGEGHVVVVRMPKTAGDKGDEVMISEGSILQRMFYRSGTSLEVLDVAACEMSSPRSTLDGSLDFTAFYTLSRDGCVRVVNAETYQSSCSVQLIEHFLDLHDPSEIEDGHIRWRNCDGIQLIGVALTTKKQVHYLLLRDVERQLLKVAETRAPRQGRLIDFAMHLVTGSDGGLARIWTIMSRTKGHMSHVDGTYALDYIDLQLPGATPTCVRGVSETTSVQCWQRVRSIEEYEELQRRRNTDTETSEEVRRDVFNVEKHSFEVVLRAIKVTCESAAVGRYSDGDWAGLMAFVMQWMRTPEFDRKFVPSDWSRAISAVSAKDTQVESELRFFRALRSSCEEIEKSERNAIGLMMVCVSGAQIIGVVQEKRVTVVLDSCKPLTVNMTRDQKDSFIDALEDSFEYDDEEDYSSDEEGNPYYKRLPKRRKNCPPKRITTNEDEEDREELVREAVEIFLKKTSMVELGEMRIPVFLEEIIEDEELEVPMDDDEMTSSSDSQVSNSSGEVSDIPRNHYDGDFTCGLIGSLLRLRLKDGLNLANRMIKMVDKKHRYLDNYRDQMVSVRTALKVLSNQLDICVERELGGVTSLCGWLFSTSSCLQVLCIEGGEGGMQMGDEPPPLYQFVERTLLATLNALHPTAKEQTLAKMLKARDKFDTLRVLYGPWGAGLPESLRCAVAYYQGVALSGTGNPRKALQKFQEAARGARAGDAALRQALIGLGISRNELTTKERHMGIGDFYVNVRRVIRLLNQHGHQQEVIELSREARAKLPEGQHLTQINATLFSRQLDGHQWSEALMTVQATKEPSIRRQSLLTLINRLLEEGDWQTIIRSDYSENTNITILANHARSIDVATSWPHPFELVSAFHVARNSFGEAATMHYELAYNLQRSLMNPQIFKRWKNALTAAVNLLDLLPKHKRFIVHPHQVEYSTGVRRTMAVVKDDDLTRMWLIVRGRCALLETCTDSIPPEDPKELIRKLATVRLFNVGLELCKHLDEDPSPIVNSAASAAIIIDSEAIGVAPEWIASNRRFLHKKEKIEHWSIVRGLVKEARKRWPKDARPLRAVAAAFLSNTLPIPNWLHRKYSKNDVGGYVRILLDYDSVSLALDTLIEFYQQAADSIISAECRLLLPHIVAEETMMLARKTTANNEEMKTKLEKFEKVVKTLQQRVKTFSRAAKF